MRRKESETEEEASLPNRKKQTMKHLKRNTVSPSGVKIFPFCFSFMRFVFLIILRCSCSVYFLDNFSFKLHTSVNINERSSKKRHTDEI